ncbi:MAG: response regulator [Acidobacteriaceae bacterium]|jgi:DNA-binding response OmpR family regulator
MIPKVLIADDERTIADTLATILGMHGFEARTAYDGEQALETARHWRPHILLTDVLMPGISGIDAATAICRMLPECRVVLLSGITWLGDLVREVQGQGFVFEVLQKPIAPEELVACLRKNGSAGQLASQG